MAKDGTARGGARVGAGTKRKSLADNILEGKSPPGLNQEMYDPADLDAEDMPKVSDFLEQTQKNGEKLMAKDVARETWKFLKKVRCEDKVSFQLVEMYSMSVARWIQCEKAISEYGFIARHPTTGSAIASPYVSMSREYMKQINQCWYQIYQTVRDNSTEGFRGARTAGWLLTRNRPNTSVIYIEGSWKGRLSIKLERRWRGWG